MGHLEHFLGDLEELGHWQAKIRAVELLWGLASALFIIPWALVHLLAFQPGSAFLLQELKNQGQVL